MGKPQEVYMANSRLELCEKPLLVEGAEPGLRRILVEVVLLALEDEARDAIAVHTAAMVPDDIWMQMRLGARDFLHDFRLSEELACSKVITIGNLTLEDEEALEARALDVSQGSAVAPRRGNGEGRNFRIGDFGEEAAVWDAFQEGLPCGKSGERPGPRRLLLILQKTWSSSEI
jgi:hypothetical protein